MKQELQFDASEAIMVSGLLVELSRLKTINVTDKAALDAWYAAAAEFRRTAYQKFNKIYDRLPHELEHYLDDADIRLKDAGYKATQDAFFNNLIRKLEAAVAPKTV